MISILSGGVEKERTLDNRKQSFEGVGRDSAAERESEAAARVSETQKERETRSD